ncbi:hypothetical protein [Vibrio pectenicida]|uniref:Uncharacterized protein n=1 Tax=Vibrio pectenicida TaxID=62763 RepID=A0A427TVV0_9VIBR|nr:hypothetical protein [Vibrio pectenicida]RSD28579.1 hypothetical protein EJA03_18985 [Vibrio pectenicida]
MANSISTIPTTWTNSISNDFESVNTKANITIIQQVENDLEQIDIIIAFINGLEKNANLLTLLMLLAKLKTQVILTILSNIPNDSIALALAKCIKNLSKKLESMQSDGILDFDIGTQVSPEFLNSILVDTISRVLTDKELDEVNSIIEQLATLHQTLNYWLKNLSI